MQFSFWEDHHYSSQHSALIIGSGIVGLSTAIELKQNDPSLSVIVVERFHPPQGASTKNAGFACFGSLTEILDDATHIPIQELKQIIRMRWEGVSILKSRLASRGADILQSGGKELFAEGRIPTSEDMQQANAIMEETLGIPSYYEWAEQSDFKGFDARYILMKHEGELNTMEMFNALYETAHDLGVKFIFGHSVESVNTKKKMAHFTSGLQLSYKVLFLCTNGFTRNLFPQMDVVPARNMVCVTEPLPDISWKGVYHYDKGYYYFRRIDNRILLGGARNMDPLTETTDQFEFNEEIRNELVRFLHEQICPEQKVKITHWWTGILGLGPSKLPIIQELDKDCYIGVRLGGMGVAIGSYLAKLLVDKAKYSL